MNFAEFLGGAAMPVLADCLRQMDRGGDGPRQGWLILSSKAARHQSASSFGVGPTVEPRRVCVLLEIARL